MVTVRQALQLSGLRESRLVAGRQGIDRVIKFVDIMEVPDVDGWLRPHEFVITCAYAIREDPAAQVQLIRTLARCDAAALAVKPARFLGKMPPAMIAVADQENLPLIDVPKDLPFIEITHPLLSAILNEQVSELQFQLDVHLRLLRLILDKNGLESVCAALAELVGSPVFVFDGSMRALAACPGKATGHAQAGHRDSEKRVAMVLRSIVARRAGSRDGYGFQDGVFWAGIKGGESPPGLLAIDRAAKGSLSATELRAVQEAATVCGLEISKLNALRETEWRLKGDFLAAMLRHETDPAEVREARAQALEVEFGRSYVVMVVQALRSGSRDSSLNGLLAAALREEGGGLGVPVTACEHDDNAVAVWSIDSEEAARRLFGEFPRRLAERMEGGATAAKELQVSLGVSRVHSGLSSVAAAHREAVGALTAQIRGRRAGEVGYYGGLAPYMLLREVDREALERFWKDQIGPLADTKGYHMLATLEAFLQCGGEVKLAARRLYIHRNTLNYRLKRITSLLRCDPRDPDVQFRLRMALLARSLSAEEDSFAG